MLYSSPSFDGAVAAHSARSRAPLIDLLKAIASQLIVWHHLAFYGPMSDVVYPHADNLIHWLYAKARIAVQVFLVVGGFLAAQSLYPRFESGRVSIPGLVAKRYVRLARPYLIALIAAILSAVLARALMPHAGNPAEPSLRQVIAHIFLLQNIAGEEALSAGVWYVAIDFQLLVLLALILCAVRWTVFHISVPFERIAVGVCAALTCLSLFWFNRNPDLDIWAPYFFGAYGLGFLANRISVSESKVWGVCLLAALITAALLVQWRDRIFIAGATALLLASAVGFAPRWMAGTLVGALARISYSVFLIHYPVCLAVNAIVFKLWGQNVLPNGLGMVAAWLLSLVAGALLYNIAERSRPQPPRPQNRDEARVPELVGAGR